MKMTKYMIGLSQLLRQRAIILSRPSFAGNEHDRDFRNIVYKKQSWKCSSNLLLRALRTHVVAAPHSFLSLSVFDQQRVDCGRFMHNTRMQATSSILHVHPHMRASGSRNCDQRQKTRTSVHRPQTHEKIRFEI